MARIKTKIVGIKPLFFHKFNIETLTDQKKPKTGTTGNNPEEWKQSFFQDNNKLYIPGAYIFAALKNGAVNTKAGRGTIQKTFISAVNVMDEKIYFNRSVWDGWEEDEFENVPTNSDDPVYVDVRMVANPNTKGRNIRYRLALSPGWELEFSLEYDESLLSLSQIKKVIEDTGKLQGIADGRSLGYGRYEVEEFTVLDKKK